MSAEIGVTVDTANFGRRAKTGGMATIETKNPLNDYGILVPAAG